MKCDCVVCNTWERSEEKNTRHTPKIINKCVFELTHAASQSWILSQRVAASCQIARFRARATNKVQNWRTGTKKHINDVWGQQMATNGKSIKKTIPFHFIFVPKIFFFFFIIIIVASSYFLRSIARLLCSSSSWFFPISVCLISGLGAWEHWSSLSHV